MADDGVTPLGIDLATKHSDVRRLVVRHCLVAALDTDDLLQEVNFAILRKNRTASAWDARRSSFGHYVCIVARSIAGHMLEAKRWRAVGSGEQAPDVADEHDPIDAFESALDAAREEGIDLAETRAAGELVTRPLAPWELALKQRAHQQTRAAAYRRWRAASKAPIVSPPVEGAAPASAVPVLKSEGHRLLRLADRLFGRDALALAADVGTKAIRPWLSGYFRPGPAARARLLVAYGIPVDAWGADPLIADDADAPPSVAPTHRELVAQLRASLAAYEARSPRAAVDVGLDLGDAHEAAVATPAPCAEVLSTDDAPLAEKSPIALDDARPVLLAEPSASPAVSVRRRFGLGLGRFARLDVEELLGACSHAG